MNIFWVAAMISVVLRFLCTFGVLVPENILGTVCIGIVSLCNFLIALGVV